MNDVVSLDIERRKNEIVKALDMVSAVENIVSRGSFNACVAHGRAIVPLLIEAVEQNQYPGKAMYAIEALGIIGDELGVEAIRSRINWFPDDCKTALRKIKLKTMLAELEDKEVNQ